MRVAFYTLGCKVNQYETQVMREEFVKRGHSLVSEQGDFDCLVINSCTVTAESDRKTRQALRRFRRQCSNGILVLTGCMVQAFSDEAQQLTEADVIVGNTSVKEIPLLAEQFAQNGERILKLNPHKERERFNTPDIESFAERTRAYMKIQDGCERYCSYCIIPKARGFVRSKPLGDIKREAESLAKNGFSEVVLVGINLTSYGKGEGFDLADAVDAVCSVEGIKRVRLGSLEPDHISDTMLSGFKAQNKFCPQFHLSLQSGCDSTLKRMNRHYDTAFYTDLVERIRKTFKDAAITTDIMVGFAGETQKEFEQSLKFLEKTGFAKCHIFAYSRRKGTVAYGLPNQVSNKEKAERSRQMIAAANKSEEDFLKSQIGNEYEVLFETEEMGSYYGYTKNYSRLQVADSPADLRGSLKRVKAVAVKKDILVGELV